MRVSTPSATWSDRCWSSLGLTHPALGTSTEDNTLVVLTERYWAKPKVPARAPKALQGEGTPERLLEAGRRRRTARTPPLARARPRLHRHGAAHGPAPLRAAGPGPGLYRRPGGRAPPQGHRQGLQGPLRADRGPPRARHQPLPLDPQGPRPQWEARPLLSPLRRRTRRAPPAGRSAVPGTPVLPLGRRRCPGPQGSTGNTSQVYIDATANEQRGCPGTTPTKPLGVSPRACELPLPRLRRG